MNKVLFLVIFVLILVIFWLIFRCKKSYNSGFDVGVLTSFYWIETNTNCKNAIEIYEKVVNEHPEDGIYYFQKTRNGRLKTKNRGKILVFQSKN